MHTINVSKFTYQIFGVYILSIKIVHEHFKWKIYVEVYAENSRLSESITNVRVLKTP